MTLFSLAKKNMSGNLKSYLLYFVSMTLSVVIYFRFVVLQYSPEIQTSLSQWPTLEGVFLQASFMLILFVAIFIWYSSSFFTNKRKREVGLYTLFGVRKKTVGLLLFYENIVMGLLSLVAGVLLGTLLSRLFAMMLLRLIGADSAVTFHFSWEAIANTSFLFCVIIAIASFRAYRLIYRFRLIELFQAEKVGERAPRTSVIAAAIGVALVAFGYWLLGRPAETSVAIAVVMGVFAVCAIAGTYLFFRFCIGYLIKAVRADKARYYKGLRMIGVSNLLYRIEGNARLLTSISLLSAATLIAISIGYASYYNVEQNAKSASPFSFSHLAGDSSFDEQAGRIIGGDPEHPLIAQLDVTVAPLSSDIRSLPYVPNNFSPNDMPVRVISLNTLQAISEALGRQIELQLSHGEAAMIRPYYTDHAPRDYIGRSIELHTGGAGDAVTFVQLLEERLMIWSYPDFYIVVSNSLFADIAAHNETIVYRAYKEHNEQGAELMSGQLLALDGEMEMTSYYAEYASRLGSAGLDIFLLSFLGLVFLAATGSMIYFKQLTEAESDKHRYAILRKIGVSRKEIVRSIAGQVAVAFGLPLLVGITHWMMTLQWLFDINLVNGNMATPVLTAAAAYLIIYALYYWLTVYASQNIVSGWRARTSGYK